MEERVVGVEKNCAVSTQIAKAVGDTPAMGVDIPYGYLTKWINSILSETYSPTWISEAGYKLVYKSINKKDV